MDSLAVMKPEDLKIDLVLWNGYAIEAEKTAEAISIVDDVEEGMAVDYLSKIKTFQKETEVARVAHVDPFNILVKRVNGMFKPIATSLESAETAIKTKIKFYRGEKERVRLALEAKQQKEYEEKIAAEQVEAKAKGEEARIVAPPPAIMPAAQTTRGDVGAATLKKFWNYECTDVVALAAAHPELVKMEPKRREILAVIKTNQHIPGLRCFEDTDVMAR
jgi:hypothetical protein